MRHDTQPGHACHECHVPRGQARRAVGATLYFPAVADGNAGLYPLVIYYSIFALQLFIVTSSCASCTFIYTACGGDKGMRNGSRNCSCLAQKRKGRGDLGVLARREQRARGRQTSEP